MKKYNNIVKMFTEAADTYDLANRILTVGFDRYWRSTTANYASQFGGNVWLDVNSGTGDMAIQLRKKGGKNVKIIATDFCPSMMEVAKKKKGSYNIDFQIADSKNLPFEDDSIDTITISFATRNLNSGQGELNEYFREFFRVLKPGGRFINLETTVPESAIMRGILYTYARLLVAPLGYLISRSKSAYRYLSYTIRHFYSAEELSGILYEAGFSKVSYHYLTFGLCAVHTSVKK